jgi:hypothetical protein
MGILETATTPATTDTPAAVDTRTNEERAVALLEEMDRAGSTDENTSSDDDSQSDDPRATLSDSSAAGTASGKPKPEEKTPDQIIAELERQKSDLSAQALALQHQHASLSRRKAEVARQAAELESIQTQIASAKSFRDLVAIRAKREGIDPHSLWTALVDEIRNPGATDPNSELRRDVAEIKSERAKQQAAERDRLEREQAQAEAAADQQALQQWTAETVELLGTNATSWPTIAELPTQMVGAAAMMVQSQAFSLTGRIYSREEVLTFLEKQATADKAARPRSGDAPRVAGAAAPVNGAAAATANGAKPKTADPKPKRVQALTNADASPVDPRTLSPDERFELAVRQVEQLSQSG